MHWRDEVIAQIRVLQEEIEFLVGHERSIKERLSRLRHDRDSLRRRLAEPNVIETDLADASRYDVLRVPHSELKPLIDDWAKQFGPGAKTILAERAGTTSRTIRRIMKGGEADSVGLPIAEKILEAIGKDYLISTGEIKIINKNLRAAP